MERRNFGDIIGILGGFLAIFSFLKENIPSIYRVGGMVLGISMFLLYIRFYIDYALKEELSKKIDKKVEPLIRKMYKFEGWREAMNRIVFKNKKGIIDPISLLIILIIIVLIILYMQGRI